MGELTKEQLQARIADLEKNNKQLADDLKKAEAASNGSGVKELKAMVAELTASNRALQATKGNPNPTVSVEKRTYQIMHGVSHEGHKYSPAELALNASLCKHLVKIGSSALRLVNA